MINQESISDLAIKVSVIVPIYNARAYLEKCVNSIIAQTIRPLEIILVDDGSTDNSGALCDQFELKYHAKGKENKDGVMLKVIHKKNEGLTAAWKTGCLEAKGEFIGFVDADDYILPDMYEKLYQKSKQEDAQIACCGIRHVFESGNHDEWNDEMQFPKESYTAEEMKQLVYPVFINNGKFMGRGLQPNRVSKLVQRDLVLRNMWLCDDEVSVGEDYQFSLSMFLDAQKITIIPGYFPYFYYMHKSSMTGVFVPEYLEKIKRMKHHLIRVSDYYGKYDFTQQIQNDFLCLSVLHLKEAAVRNKKAGYQVARSYMKAICTDTEVSKAVREHTMNGLTLAETLFLFFMKKKLYLLAYVSVNLYFS